MELHWHHPEAFRETDRAAAEKRVAELARDRTDLIDARITAHRTGHHRHGGQEVRITCEARGKEIVAARIRPDAGRALNERPAQPPELGVIDEIRSEEGYGFILTDGGERVYFHRNAVHGGLEFERLETGQRVGLNLEGGAQGPQATVVVAPPPDEPGP